MLTKYSIKKPYVVVVMMVIVILLGIISYQNTTTDLLPNINLPYVVVASVKVGASPETVETELTKPTEEVLGTLTGVKNMNSMSMENASMTVLEFESEVNVDNIIIDIREKLNMLKGIENTKDASDKAQEGLGKKAEKDMTVEPMIFKINPSMMPIMMVSMGLKGQDNDVSSADYNKLIQKLEAVQGVASVTTQGLEEDMLLMQLDTSHLLSSAFPTLKTDPIFTTIEQNIKLEQTFGKFLTPDILNTIITAQNIDMPAGMISENGLSYFIKVGDDIKSREDLENTPLLSLSIKEPYLAIKGSTIKSNDYYQTPLNVLANIVYNLKGQEGEKEKFIKDLVETMKFAKMLIPEELKPYIDIVDTDTENPKLQLSDFLYERFFGSETQKGIILNDLGEDLYMPLKLGGITQITSIKTAGNAITTLNGEPTVALTIMKQPNFSTAEISKDLNEILEQEKENNSNFFYVTMFDQGYYINEAVSSAATNIWTGGLLAILILFLFLQKIRPTLVVGVSIAISVVFTFVLMYFSGITLNILSMGGLALGVGMLVDNSIVVIENIYRQRKLGKDAKQAAIDGTKQIVGAIIASTITTVIVFVLLFFVQGIVRTVFRDLALTITYSLLASLLFSLTLVPMASTTFLKNDVERDHKWFDKIRNGYKKSLKFCLNKRWIVVTILAVFLTGSIVGGVYMGKEFFPRANVGLISVNAEINVDNIPEGKTIDEVKNDMVYDFNNKLMPLEYVDSVGISEGTNLITSIAGISTSNNTNIVVQLKLKDKYKKHENEYKNEIAKLCESKDGLYEVRVSSETDSANIDALLGDAISVNVYCEDLEDLKEATLKYSDAIRGVEGVDTVSNGLDNLPLEYKIIVDKEKASHYGLTSAQILLQVNMALAKAEATNKIKFKGDDNFTTIKIYPDNYVIREWIKTSDENGNYVKVYVDGKYDRYIINHTGKDINLENGDTIKPNENIPVLKDLYENFFYYQLPDNTMVKFDGGTSLQYLYSAEPAEPINILTHKISNDLSKLGLDVDMGKVIKPMEIELWKLLDEDCLIWEEGNDIPVGIKKTEGYFTINHDNGRRALGITGTLKEGYNVDQVTKEIDKVIKDIDMQGMDVSYAYMGQSAIITETFDTINYILIFGIVLIYLVMVAQFQSLKLPFIVMFTIPLALSGCIYALLIAGLNISVPAMIGVIVLTGIIVNNGIVFVDYANQLIKQGMDVREALIQTGYDRLRPILMTALTTTFGMMTMAFNFSETGVMIRPMAVSAMGGLIYATLLTLYVVPVMFDLFNNRKTHGKRKNAKKQKGKKSEKIEDENSIENIKNNANVETINNEKVEKTDTKGIGKLEPKTE